VDQHAWHSIIHITLSLSLKPLQTQIIDLIESHLKAHTIHMHFRFSYTKDEDLVTIAQSDYPDFVTESNTVDVIPPDESEAEIYHGNIFADKADQLNAIDPSDPPLGKSKKKKA
jgi:phosphoribosylamine-glycine ligase